MNNCELWNCYHSQKWHSYAQIPLWVLTSGGYCIKVILPSFFKIHLIVIFGHHAKQLLQISLHLLKGGGAGNLFLKIACCFNSIQFMSLSLFVFVWLLFPFNPVIVWFQRAMYSLLALSFCLSLACGNVLPSPKLHQSVEVIPNISRCPQMIEYARFRCADLYLQ